LSHVFSRRAFIAQPFLFSHFWFATPQEVLQADWHEVWHSPQPPFFALFLRSLVCKVFMRFIRFLSFLA
jgi:hypothetical protein